MSSFIIDLHTSLNSVFLLTQIDVNGNYFTEYHHRIDPASVDSIFIDGGVKIESVVYKYPKVSILMVLLHEAVQTRGQGNKKLKN